MKYLLLFLTLFLNFVLVRSVESSEMEEDRIVAVRLQDGTMMSDALIVQRIQGRWYVPFVQLCETLGISVELDLGRGRLSGFYAKENNTYLVRLRESSAIFVGKQIPINPGDLQSQLSEVFVSIEFFQRLFPLEIQLNLFQSMITIKTEVPLPVEEERKRALRARLSSLQLSPQFKDYIGVEKRGEGFLLDQSVQYAASQSGEDKSDRLFHQGTMHGELANIE